MKIFNKNNIVNIKGDFYCKVRLKEINLNQKYKTRTPVLVIEDEPININDVVLCYSSKEKNTINDDVWFETYINENDEYIEKFVDYPSQIINDYYIENGTIILIKVKKLYNNFYYKDTEPEYLCRLKDLSIIQQYSYSKNKIIKKLQMLFWGYINNI